MNDNNFEILISEPTTTRGKKARRERITCGPLLRDVPGHRRVYGGDWNGREVIAKLFLSRLRGKFLAKSEWRGLVELKRREIYAPHPLLLGKTSDGKWAILTEKINASTGACQVFDRAQDWPEKLECLLRVAPELADQHQKGVLQTDTHLGNFLFAADSVYSLDPGRIRFYNGPAPKKQSLRQLASLALLLPDSRTQSMERLLTAYVSERRWGVQDADKRLFRKLLTKQRNIAVRRGLRKCLRTSRRILRAEGKNSVVVLDRQFCKDIADDGLTNQLDSLMDAGTILKKGNTCYVSRFEWKGNDIVVKRYNYKGFVHSFRHTIKGSRARRCWLSSSRLRMLHIPTPRPLAFIEKYKGPFLFTSYFITKYIEGRKLDDFLADECINQSEKNRIKNEVKQLVARLGRHHIKHGDLKHSNIIITSSGPQFIDLDSMKVHRLGLFYSENFGVFTGSKTISTP